MPPDQPNEQEIQFRKRARRRLVGAVALVLLMVTILPMVLDDRAAKSPQQEITISIPSQDGTEFSSKVVPVGPIMPEPVVAPKPLHEKHSVKETESAKAIEPPVPVETESPKPAKVVTPKPETPSTTETQKPSAEKDPAQNANTKSGTYTVQIGVFSDPVKIKKLQQELQDLGYKSYTEKVDTPKGEKIRLRAGPFTDREQADNALAAVKDAGLPGLVVLNK